MNLIDLNSITCILLWLILLINQSESQKNVPSNRPPPEANDYRPPPEANDYRPPPEASNLEMLPKDISKEGIMERNAGALPLSDYPEGEYAVYNQEHLSGIEAASNNEVYGIPEATEDSSYPMYPAMSMPEHGADVFEPPQSSSPRPDSPSQPHDYDVPPLSQGPSQPHDYNVPPRPYSYRGPPRQTHSHHLRRLSPEYSALQAYYPSPTPPELRQQYGYRYSHHDRHHHNHNPRPFNQDYMADTAIDRRFGPGNRPYRQDDQFHRHH